MSGGASFTTDDGLRISYQQWAPERPPPPVALHHGFVVDANVNWVATGVVDALLAAGRHVVAPDARGHGASDKPHDPSRYGEARMARDLGGLLDALALAQVDLVGYSMGAVVALIFAAGAGARVRRLVVGGVGAAVVECGGVDRRAVSNESIIEALAADDPSTIEAPGAKAFRALADAVGADREALIAQATSVHRGQIALERITAPTLVLAGDSDPLARTPHLLADAIPDASLQVVAGDHLGALADPLFTASLTSFLV